MSQLAYRKHLQRQVVFGARILKQRARRFNFMRCGNRWNVRLRNVRLTSTRSFRISDLKWTAPPPPPPPPPHFSYIGPEVDCPPPPLFVSDLKRIAPPPPPPPLFGWGTPLAEILDTPLRASLLVLPMTF